MYFFGWWISSDIVINEGVSVSVCACYTVDQTQQWAENRKPNKNTQETVSHGQKLTTDEGVKDEVLY